MVSDDEGTSWRQVESPVSSDLVAVRFVSAYQGFASGHDGVILATTDGGEHWTNIGAGLPDAPVNSVVVDPSDAKTLYVGTVVRPERVPAIVTSGFWNTGRTFVGSAASRATPSG